MTTTRQFFDTMDAFNNRVHQAEQTVRALQAEHEVLRAQAGDYMRLSQFDQEIARVVTFKFVFPDGFRPAEPAPAQLAEQAIIRHPDKAAE